MRIKGIAMKTIFLMTEESTFLICTIQIYIHLIMWPGDTSIRKLNGTATNEYLTKLDQPSRYAVSTGLFDPELIIYSAGTDILDGDPLGRLKISPDGIPMRDERVFRFAREKNIPIVMLKSDIGGYMKSIAKVIADSIINLSKKSR
ncbi:histone deacetylase 2-like [Primulina tabacum]|uniref:histone deacetylase 2-like n=1 Tax=Primulina tabacum TaxID=48773 RepID=UPI003F5AB58D